ncbi:conserved hypothetical protein [Desulforamulus reducens MI-1]|uniref:Nucleotidase n=1 Tax=Desulforamulus reducens (strain ATCC BAA-1160 / DSM 100696 / MI-1) TaxID=349161 RepID=A4J2S2_DESRM|nr:hypothetical protein [Desulforamulus reducens]ABO49375.1 conserved hypothetical protein [Desulforamulus reducens MI-1]
MLVGVDICNTISNVNYELLQRFNINLKVYPAPEVPEHFFTSPDGLKIFATARPYFRAKEMLHMISASGYKLIYMTSRPKMAEFVTRRWLDIHDFPHGRVEFVSSKEKAIMAHDAGMVAFFDDDPFVIKDLIQKGIPRVFVKTAPYNRHFASENVFRFNVWTEVTPYIKKRA